jgi:hypothetical protein
MYNNMQKFGDKIIYNAVEEILKSLAHSVSGMGCTTRICKNNF